MICYKDMTFCDLWEKCKFGNGCTRALTDEIKTAAEKWMKDAPIAVYSGEPDCFKSKEV